MSNCLFFALRQYLVRGGYLIMRKSKHYWGPHFLWSPDMKVFFDYVPKYPTDGLLCPPPLFRGEVRGRRGCD